jgi:hypothetical protein
LQQEYKKEVLKLEEVERLFSLNLSNPSNTGRSFSESELTSLAIDYLQKNGIANIPTMFISSFIHERGIVNSKQLLNHLRQAYHNSVKT